MKNTIMIFVILLIIVIGGYFMFFNGSSTTTSNTTPTTPSTTKPINSAPVTVNIKNFSFSPQTLNIKIGTNVIWTNNDTVPHTITSDSGNLLNSGNIAPGASFNQTFSSAGSINYHCNIHPMMKGSITVTN